MNVPRRYVISAMLFFLAACASTPEPRERLVDHVQPGWTIEQLVRTLGKPDQLTHGVAHEHYVGVAVYHLADGLATFRTQDDHVTEIEIRHSLPSQPVVASKPPWSATPLAAASSINQQLAPTGSQPPYTGLGIVQPTGESEERIITPEASTMKRHAQADSDVPRQYYASPPYAGLGVIRPVQSVASSPPANAVSQQIGPFGYSTLYTSSGETLNTTSQTIGPFTYSRTSGSNGYSSSATQQRIGSIDYVNGTSTQGTYSGSTQHIGTFGFTNLNTPSGTWRGTSQTIGPFTYQTFYGPNGQLVTSTTQQIGTQTFTTITPP